MVLVPHLNKIGNLVFGLILQNQIMVLVSFFKKKILVPFLVSIPCIIEVGNPIMGPVR
jgi:hypothetical protein